jgi:hypothetical protein
MNSKLAQFAGQNVAPGHPRRGCVPSNSLVSVSKSDENKGRHVVRISFHARAIKQLGWQLHDHIQMTVMTDGAILLSRDNDRGRSLCKAIGSAGRTYLRFAVIPEFFAAIPTGAGSQVEIADGRMAFCLP